MKKTILVIIAWLILVGCTASIIYINKSHGNDIENKFKTDPETDTDFNFKKQDSIKD